MVGSPSRSSSCAKAGRCNASSVSSCWWTISRPPGIREVSEIECRPYPSACSRRTSSEVLEAGRWESEGVGGGRTDEERQGECGEEDGWACGDVAKSERSLVGGMLVLFYKFWKSGEMKFVFNIALILFKRRNRDVYLESILYNILIKPTRESHLETNPEAWLHNLTNTLIGQQGTSFTI